MMPYRLTHDIFDGGSKVAFQASDAYYWKDIVF